MCSVQPQSAWWGLYFLTVCEVVGGGGVYVSWRRNHFLSIINIIKQHLRWARDTTAVVKCYCVSVQFSRSVVSDSLRPHRLQHARPPLSITNSWSLLKLTSIESVMSSNDLILCRPLLLLPSIFPSIRVFSNEWALRMRWPKYWSFSFNISPSN